MNQEQKEKAAILLETYTDMLIADGLSPEAAFNRALGAVNRMINDVVYD